jgi:hypothetical protein
MQMILSAATAMAALSIPIDTHQVTVQHQGRDVTAAYTATIDIETRQRGIAPPMRASTQQCDWQAVVKVERSVAGSTLPARLVATDRSQKGTIAGDCRMLGRQIDGAVAGRAPAIEQRLAAIAGEDRATLLAEIDRLAVVASND